VGEYSDRSNDPRITKGAKYDPDLYQMALEVARQSADTPEQRKQQKRAAVYARAFESRFQKEAFKLSGRSPLSAGGKGSYKDPEKVKMNIKNPSAKKSTALKVAGAAGKVAGKATRTAKKVVKAEVGAAKKAVGFTAKAAMAPSVGVTKVAKAGLKALAKEPRPTRQVGKGAPIKQMYSNKNLKKK
jgi:hypothetical protein